MGSTAGYSDFIHEISSLISTYPPQFIYVTDTTSLPATTRILASALASPDLLVHSDYAIHHVNIDATLCFTQRLLFDEILNALAQWEITWDTGYSVVDSESLGGRWNDSWDGFLHGLKHIHTKLSAVVNKPLRFVVSITYAQKIKERLPDCIMPLSRLKELSQLDITVILLSQTQWQDVKPPLGTSPDPYFIDINPLSKQDITTHLSSRFSTISSTTSTSDSSTSNPVSPYSKYYTPSLQNLYTHYITTLVDICYPFTHDLDELSYIAAVRWPGFVKPLFTSTSSHETESETNLDETTSESDTLMIEPTEDIRLRLIKLFNPTITQALEQLHPRLTNATTWAKLNDPPPSLLSQSQSQPQPLSSQFALNLNISNQNSSLPPTPSRRLGSGVVGTKPGSTEDKDKGLSSLPRISKFILLASYIASTNPPKSDIRMFGRGLDEKKRKRKATMRKTKTKGPSKIPQQLLGPTSFPIDRMIAILGAILEENDADSGWRLPAPEFMIPGEYTDNEIGRIAIQNSVMELTSMHLLLRTSPMDRIDGPPQFKSAISLDTALTLAKELDVPLNDLLWEVV